MLQKTTEDESDKQSLSTKAPQPTKAASFTITSKRHMYRNKSNQPNAPQLLEFCNVLNLTPNFISTVIHDQAEFLDNG